MSHYPKCEYIKENLFRKRIKNALSMVVYRLCLMCISKRPSHNNANSIAIVFLASLGDMVVLCGVAKTLKAAGKSLTLICKQGNGAAEFAQETALFDEIIELNINGIKRFSNLRMLRSLEFDAVFCAPLGRHILPDVYACAIKANKRFFPDTLQDCSSVWLKRAVDKRADKLININSIYELDRYSEFINSCGFTCAPADMYYLPTPLKERSDILAIFPGAGGGTQKQWECDKFAFVAKQLAEDGLISKVLVLGSDTDRACCNELYGMLHGYCDVQNLCASTSISDIVDILSGCCLTLANDSGSAHISASCKTPTLVICGMWQYGRFYPNPYCDNLISVSDEGDFCQSCYHSTPLCDCSPAPCISNIDELCVLEQAKALLGRKHNA